MAKKTLSNIDFVTIAGIASYCMVCPATVRRWINSGKLHALKLPGGHFRVTILDLRKFLGENNIPVPPELFRKRENSN
jgi:excisionase family DNA binding protein